MFPANLDVWKSLISGEKYIGKHLPMAYGFNGYYPCFAVRFPICLPTPRPIPLFYPIPAGLRHYWIDKNWDFHTSLLAVRRFRPAPDLDDYRTKASEVLKDWAENVLLDFGLTWADIFGATSDAGADVKAVFTTVVKLVSIKGVNDLP